MSRTDYFSDSLLESAIKLIEANPKFHAALSNPSFEFWYLLHFVETTRPFLNANEVIKELQNYLSHTYEKRLDMFDLLLPHIEVAIKRAARILDDNTDETIAPNPSTQVHILVKLLQSMKR